MKIRIGFLRLEMRTAAIPISTETTKGPTANKMLIAHQFFVIWLKAIGPSSSVRMLSMPATINVTTAWIISKVPTNGLAVSSNLLS